MKVAVSSGGTDLDAQVSPIFGRCAYFVMVDSETMEATALTNNAVGASGGAGIQSAQYVLRQGAEAVISGNIGPNSMQVLVAAGVPVYAVDSLTVREAIEALKAGKLQAVGSPTVGSDYGKPGAGPGGGLGGGRRGGGMGGGRGRGG